MNAPDERAARERRFACLYTRAYADVLRFVQRRAGPDRAEDVVHEAFLVAWRRLDVVPEREDDARAWLFGVARHCLLAEHRGAARRTALGVRLGSASDAPADAPEDVVALRLDLAVAWRRLRPGEQEVLALATWDDLTSPQAGRVLGISSAAYRIRLHRARAALRRHLDPAPAGTTRTLVADLAGSPAPE